MKLLTVLTVLISCLVLTGCSNSSIAIVDEPLNIEKQDQFTQNLDLLLTRNIGNFTLLHNLELGDKIMNITTTVIPESDQLLGFKDIDGNLFTLSRISNVTSLGGNNYNIQLLEGVEYNYTIEDSRSIRSSNMAVDGRTNPIIFQITPVGLDINVEWDLTRLICVSSGDGVGASNDIPDLTSLFTTGSTDKGILFRVINTIYHKNLFYARTNNDFVKASFDYNINPANRQGDFTFTFRKTYNGDDKSGVVLRLMADSTSDGYHSIQGIIERDLTDVNLIECNFMGHETDSYSESLE